MPEHLKQTVETLLGESITSLVSLGGGCIGNACRVDTAISRFFLKWGEEGAGRTFEAEADGLRLLRSSRSRLYIPAVLAATSSGVDTPGVLVLEWIETGSPGSEFWEDFGQGLAELHRCAAKQYGADQDNFIGRLPQCNNWVESWPDFFRANRLEPQVQIARESGRWQRRWDAPLALLYDRLHDLLPGHPEASVLHGDLWSGNFMVTSSGRAALIDPAAYHGHRETDLAMTELFGGFDARFYAAYREAWPLQHGYPGRRDVYNLYHLVNHLNHFGAGYARSVESILERFM